MRPAKLRKGVLNYTVKQWGDDGREYLGMSQIGKCPARLYLDLMYGQEVNFQLSLYGHLGEMFEKDMIRRIEQAFDLEVGPSRELIDFDGQFQGHTDGEIDETLLLEIKSTTSARIKKVAATKTPYHPHRWQVQAYMHYGPWERCHIVYVARDDGSIFVVEEFRSSSYGEKIRAKADGILEAVHLKVPPHCTCGFCRSRVTLDQHKMGG